MTHSTNSPDKIDLARNTAGLSLIHIFGKDTSPDDTQFEKTLN